MRRIGFLRFKHNFKQFISCYFFVIAYLLLLFFLLAFSLYFIRLGMPANMLFYVFCRFAFYICVVTSTISWIYLTRPKVQSVDETLQSIDKNRFYYQFYGFLLQVLLAVMLHIILYVILIVCSKLNDADSYFISYFNSSFLCNIVIPQFICLFFTYTLSKMKNYRLTLCIYIGFLVLISPFAEKLVWEVKPEVFPVDQFIKYIRWPFTILYQNGAWSADIQYGFQTEYSRIAVLCFWPVFLLFINIIENRSKTEKKILHYITSSISCIIAITILIYSYLPSSLYRLNFSWDGIFKDFNIYDAFHGKNQLVNESAEQLDYRVEEYIMKIDFNRIMCVNAELKISSDKPKKEFVFTLYRGYHVKKVEVSDQNIQYKQVEDQLIFNTDEPTNRLDVKIYYEGFHNKFYSNSLAAMLPAYFPWYPMAGNKQIFTEYSNIIDAYGYNPYNKIQPAYIKVQTNGRFPIASNLEMIENTIFEGVSDGISLFGGNIVLTEDSLFKNYLPFELDKTYTLNDCLKNQKKELDNVIEQLEVKYGLDASFLKNKEILCPSKDIGRNFSNNAFAVFQDYIIAQEGYINIYDVMQYLILQNDRKSRLISAFYFYGINDSIEVGLEQMKQYCQNKIQMLPDEEKSEWRELERQIDVAVEKVGIDIFIKKVAEYAVSKVDIESDNEFFLSIGGAK